jgi:polygalacturonase
VTLHLDRGAVLLAAGEPPPNHEHILAMLSPEGTLPGGGKGDAGSFYQGDTFGLDEPEGPPPKPAAALSFAAAFDRSQQQHPPANGNGETSQRPAPGEETYDPPEPNPHNEYQDHGHSHWHNSLIWGENLQNVGIIGEGMIDGRGLTWNADPLNPTGNKAIALKNCRGVTLRDFRIFRGGHFAVLATGCEDITVEGVQIDSNRDGLDFDGCRRVTVTGCHINTPNDDAIVLKSSYATGALRPCEDITIRDCRVTGYDMGSMFDGTFRTSQKLAPDRGGPTGRIKFGTESNGGYRRVVIADCTFEHSRGLALEIVDGGVMEDITITNITMRDITSAPLFIRLGNRARGPAGTPVGKIRRISISNVVATDVEPRYASLISGIPGHFIEDVYLADIQIQYRGGGGKLDAKMRPAERENAYPEPNMFGVIPAYGLYCRHVQNLRLQNVSLYFMKPDQRPAVILNDVHNATFSTLMMSHVPRVPAMVLDHVSRVSIQHSPPIDDVQIARASRQVLG